MILHPKKAGFIPETGTLITSDIHIGKSRHFMQSGLPLPAETSTINYKNIAELFSAFQPAHWIVLGDLVHSSENSEWAEFQQFVDTLPPIPKTLVVGNHDRFLEQKSMPFGFSCTHAFTQGNLIFMHESHESVPNGFFCVSGHVHPAILLSGKARQRLRTPCFWLSESGLVMPAFGSFTGSHTIQPKKSDRVFGCIENEVIELTHGPSLRI